MIIISLIRVFGHSDTWILLSIGQIWGNLNVSISDIGNGLKATKIGNYYQEL